MSSRLELENENEYNLAALATPVETLPLGRHGGWQAFGAGSRLQ